MKQKLIIFSLTMPISLVRLTLIGLAKLGEKAEALDYIVAKFYAKKLLIQLCGIGRKMNDR